MRAVVTAAVAVALALFLPLEFPAGEGQAEQQAAFEYEVLSGIRGDTRINYGWHKSSTGLNGGWEEGHALDLVPDYAVGKAAAGERVHAVFRYGSGPALKAVAEPLDTRLCKIVLVELYDGEGSSVAIVEYVHIDRESSASTPTKWDLEAEDGAVTSKQVGTIAGDENPKCKKSDNGIVYWTGPHLHQRVRVSGEEEVDSTRDASLDGVGQPDRWVSGGIWLSPGSWVRERYFSQTTSVFGAITNTGGDGVSHRSSCGDDARTGKPGAPEGHPVQVLEYGSGSCAGWLRVMSAAGRLCGAADRAYWNIWRGTEPSNWSPKRLTTACPSYAPPTPPAAPTGLTATAGNGSIDLAWTDPGDTSITGYEYRTKTSSATTWGNWQTITGATDATTSHTISDLTNGTTYSVQIRARNAGGAGGASSTVSATPTAPPAAPTGLTATAGNGSIDLAWTDPGDTSITGYEYRTKTSSATTWGTWQTITGATDATTSHTISDLTNGTTYSVQIRARNAGGAGGASSTVSATPTAPPPPPPPPPPPAAARCTLTVEPNPDEAADTARSEHDCGATVQPAHPPVKDACFTPSGTLSEVTLTSDTTVTANYDRLRYTLTVQPSPAAAANTATSEHDCDDDVTPTHPPAANACFVPSGTLPEVKMTSDKTVTANYTRLKYTLTMSAGSGGSVSPASGNHDCTVPAKVVSISANADDGYRFDGWTGDAADASSSSTTVTMDGDKSASASFVKTYTLTVSVSPTGGGSVSGGGTFDEGDEARLTATAASGYRFQEWYNADRTSGSTAWVTMNGNKSVTAVFKRQYTLSTSASPSGSATTTGDGTYDAGSRVTVTATASYPGYTFDYWQIKGGSSGPADGPAGSSDGSFTVTMNGDKQAIAHFTASEQCDIDPELCGW